MKRVSLQKCAGPPKVLHYGNELAVNNITYYEFNKIEMKAKKFNPLECPPWTKRDGNFSSGLLPFPPSPLAFESKAGNCLSHLMSACGSPSFNLSICQF